MFDNIKKIIFYSVIGLFCCQQSQAVTQAGEKQTKIKKEPRAAMYVSNNITDLGGGSTTDAVEEVVFSADEMINDDENDTIIAKGNVIIEYNNMRLRTDKLIYEQQKDVITAINNVKVQTSDGNIIYGDLVTLSERMTIGDMYNIKAILKDKSRVLAESFRKKNNQTKTLLWASYTACDVCEGKNPLWEVNARKVQHNEKSKNVNYNDAFLRIKGVPIFYTPFLTHPDPTVKRRSGFMPPSMGSSNFLGAYIQPRYFWAVDDNTNVLFAPIFSADKNIVWGGAYSQYFYNSDIDLSGTYLRDDEDNRPEHRGNIFASGRYDINDYWRMKYDLKYVSDYIYLKELSLPYQDDAWLNSSIGFERFSGRDYASVEMFYYKMLSYSLHSGNSAQYYKINSKKPFVAPLIEIDAYSDPYANGSHFKNNLSTASIYHRNGQETQRVTSINAWELPYTTRFGEKYKFVTSLKSDAYYINKYPYSVDNTYTGTTARFFPQAGVEWRLPFVRATDSSRQILEPVIVGVVAPDGGNKIDKIPNEDSEDVYFDDTNVLDLDRYAGYDRNDTGSRLSYGLRWNSYGNIMGRTSAFLAQTYERKSNSSFTESLDNKDRSHFSDYVGRFNAQPNEYLELNYRFRLDKDSLDAKYSEVGTTFGPSFLKFNASYIFLQGNTHYYDLYSQRKELYTSVDVKISQFWSASLYNLKDLTSKNKGTLEHGGSVIYEDECFKWETIFKKYNSSNPELDNDYEFGTTFYLKTIGSFGS